MEKISFDKLRDVFYKHNEEKGITSQYGDQNALTGVVVFKTTNFTKDYSLESRSYKFTSDNKMFVPGMIGNSVFAESLDGTDNIRLDWYVFDWDIDYCYIAE